MKNNKVSVYVAECAGQYKIGFAVDVSGRLRSMSTSCPFPITLYKSWPVDNARKVERALHERLVDFRVRGEWFALPDTVLRDLDRLVGEYRFDVDFARLSVCPPLPEPSEYAANLPAAIREVEIRYAAHALGLSGGNVSSAAAILGIDRKTLYRIIDREPVLKPFRLHGRT